MNPGVRDLAEAIRRSPRVYVCGNGGSAANALHIVNDLVSCGIKAYALTGDISTLTAIANDYSYDEVFSHQIEVFGEPGDLLLVLSGSGNSKNIVRAIDAAKEKGMRTWALLGMTGGAARYRADHALWGRVNMQRAEERQLEVGHELLRLLGGKR